MSNKDRTHRVRVDMSTDNNAPKNATVEYSVSRGSQESVIN
jgi:hypothetical protein